MISLFVKYSTKTDYTKRFTHTKAFIDSIVSYHFFFARSTE